MGLTVSKHHRCHQWRFACSGLGLVPRDAWFSVAGFVALLLGVLAALVGGEALAQAQSQPGDKSINAIRMSSAPDRTRVWVELSAPAEYKVFQLQNPPRLVVDFEPLAWNVDRGNMVTSEGYVSAVRFGQNSATTSRLVLDLTAKVDSSHSLFVAPYEGADHRLVLELVGEGAATAQATASSSTTAQVDQAQPSTQARATTYVTMANGTALPMPGQRPSNVPAKPSHLTTVYTVVIDAGHGGKDPGASGRGGVVEKQVTLAAARALAAKLNATGRYRAVLTRSDDTFIPLRDRPRIGREAGGDLFISLHADSAANASLSGASVYTLSETASDRESAALAERENESDAVAGIPITDYPEDIRNILLDLAMRRTLNESSRFAEIVVKTLREDWKVLPSKPHRFAGFAVLSSADMPSVLIEMGYLTNSSDVRMLGSATERMRFVDSITDSIHGYFESLGGSI